MTEDDWLLALAGWGIGGRSLPECPGPIEGLLRRIDDQKLVGVLAAAVAAGDVEVGPASRRSIADAHRRSMGEALLLEEMLLEAITSLDSAGIEHRVLKGSALAHLVHPDPSQRSFGDNDILVRSDDIGRAVELLVAIGAERVQPRLSAGFDRRFSKSITLRWLHNTEIDLHRTLAPGPFGLMVHTEDLWADPVEFHLAGRTLLTVPLGLHLLNAAIHVALGDVDARLGNLRDVALLSDAPDVDNEEVLATAARWGCETPLAEGISAAGRVAAEGGDLLEWADLHEPSGRDLRLLSTYSRTRGRFRRQALASLRVLPRWRDRVAYTSAVARNPLRRVMGSRYARRS